MHYLKPKKISRGFLDQERVINIIIFKTLQCTGEGLQHMGQIKEVELFMTPAWLAMSVVIIMIVIININIISKKEMDKNRTWGK